MPNFKAGSHDRVFSGQLNGAVSLTDPTTLLLSEYQHDKNILFYDLNHMDEISSMVDSHLDKPDELKKIAQGGFNIANANHTWANIAKLILNNL